MRILYLWICLCVCGIWSHTALADRLYVWNKSNEEYFAYKEDGSAFYIPSNTTFVSATDDLTFYSLNAINDAIHRGTLFIQLDGNSELKLYVTNRFAEFWSYYENNYSTHTVTISQFSYIQESLANSTIQIASDTGYVVNYGDAIAVPWTYYDGVTFQNIEVFPRKVTNWTSAPGRLTLRVEGRIPDSDFGQHPEAPPNFGSQYALTFMDYPYMYDATVYPTPRTPQNWSDAKIATYARKRPVAFSGTLFDPAAITEELREISSLPADTFNLNYGDEINGWLGEQIPDGNNNVGADGTAPPGDLSHVDGQGDDATLQDVVDAIKDLSVDIEFPEEQWQGLTEAEFYSEPSFGSLGSREDDWFTSSLELGSGNINIQETQNKNYIPNYLEIGEHKIPLGAMFTEYPMNIAAKWIKIILTTGLYLSFAMLVLNDCQKLLIGASQVTQVTGNTETSGGIGFAQISSRVPSAVANHLFIVTAILGLVGTILGVAATGLVPNWNFTQVVQEAFNAAPYLIKVGLGFISPFFPTELLVELAIGALIFKVVSITTYGITTIAIKTASA